jgi:UDP-GlcNAc:undecaprenyl-phosphate GlcNAc-1-phosphate transferase
MNGSSVIAVSTSLGLSLILTPLVRHVCRRLRLYDLPGPLKIHSQPVPRLGGIAIALAFVAGVALERIRINSSTWLIFLALFLIWVTGVVDDLRGLSPLLRLVGQICAAVLLWYGGWRVSWIGADLPSLITTCLFVILFVNAFNFLDGADGLAAGVSIIISIGYLSLPAGIEGPFGIAVASGLLGTCAGFLAFNFPPATIFMGDSGSTLLGFGVAFLGLDFYRGGIPANSQLLFPVIVAALPLLDAGLAILRRLQNRGSPLQGDRRHFYDLLLVRGWSSRNVVFVSCALTGLLAAAGRMSISMNASPAFLICVSCVGGVLAAGLMLGLHRTPSAPTVTRQART